MAWGFGAGWEDRDLCSPPPRPGGTAPLGAQPLICTVSLAPVPTPAVALGPGSHGTSPPGCLSGRVRGSLHCGLPNATRLNWGNRVPQFHRESHFILGPLSRRGAAGGWLPTTGWRQRGVPPTTPEVAPGVVPPRAPALLRHPLLSLLCHLCPLPPSILPHGDPVAGGTSMGTSQPTRRNPPPAPGKAKSCTQEHRCPPGGGARAGHAEGAAVPPDQAIPVSPRTVLGLCPFAASAASLWAPQPGAAPHPRRGAGCPFPLVRLCTPRPPPCPLGAPGCPPPPQSPPAAAPRPWPHWHRRSRCRVRRAVPEGFFMGGDLTSATRAPGPDPAPG